MTDINEIIEIINSAVAGLPFFLTAALLAGSFVFIFAAALVACYVSPRARSADKRPFFHYLNLYTALFFAVTAAHFSLGSALVPAALFWIIGYLMYGLLCLTGSRREAPLPEVGYTVTAPEPPRPKTVYPRPDVPAAKTDVRLEHAIGITERLLSREVGRSDRQELEKIKGTLAFLHGKGSLTVQESDILNDNFNALLKLMAKYNE